MNRKEANKIIEKHSAAFGALPREAIEAIEYLINAEPCRETDDYENEIADLQNRLDISEYDKERWKEKVTVLDEKLKALSAEPCEDAISRQAVIDAIRKSRFLVDATEKVIKLPPVEPCEDAISRHDAILLADELKDDLPDDEQMADMVMAHNEGVSEYQTKLSLLPSVTPKQKVGHWISFGVQGEVDGQIVRAFTCSECGAISIFRMASGSIVNGDLCPNCGAKMGESGVWE